VQFGDFPNITLVSNLLKKVADKISDSIIAADLQSMSRDVNGATRAHQVMLLVSHLLVIFIVMWCLHWRSGADCPPDSFESYRHVHEIT
jgi:hypothetical protein